jgi:hypothetical protein
MNRISEENSVCLDSPPSTNRANGARSRPGATKERPSINGNNGAQPTSEGRNAQGRFAKGNRGGPGNPFARQTAGLRRALVNSVSRADIEAIGQRIVALAMDGDMAAAKLLFAYVIGKPADVVDPDTLDVQEWQTFCQKPVQPSAVTRLMDLWPAEMVCKVMRLVLPCVADNHAKQLRQTLLGETPRSDTAPDDVPDDAREADKPPARVASARTPSTNRANGAETRGQSARAPCPSPIPTALRKPPPSTKGANGGQVRSQPGAKRPSRAARILTSALRKPPGV